MINTDVERQVLRLFQSHGVRYDSILDVPDSALITLLHAEAARACFVMKSALFVVDLLSDLDPALFVESVDELNSLIQFMNIPGTFPKGSREYFFGNDDDAIVSEIKFGQISHSKILAQTERLQDLCHWAINRLDATREILNTTEYTAPRRIVDRLIGEINLTNFYIPDATVVINAVKH